ncbi:MAG: hypothetical protein LIO58_07425 [Oscillospiraceae bacterium]|nr:hypothetical protein [Oscillospiraceae bacterium]
MYTTTGRVGASQTGADGTMKLVSALDAVQDCSTLWMESEPGFVRFLTENHAGMFVLFRQADLLRLPAYGERFHVTTGIYRCAGYSGYRNTVLYGADGAPCVQSWSLGAFVSHESGRLLKLPPEESGRIVLDPKVDMQYLDRHITLPDIPCRALPEQPVRRGDIDFNGHMNNVRYVETALELLPEARAVARLRIEYKASARLGDVLCPTLGETEHHAWLTLSDRNGSPYAIMEFSK